MATCRVAAGALSGVAATVSAATFYSFPSASPSFSSSPAQSSSSSSSAPPLARGATTSVVRCEEKTNFPLHIGKEQYLAKKRAASTVYVEAKGGLRYCEKRIGSGKEAVRGALVGVHFEGFRLNGRTVESTFQSSSMPLIIEAGNSPEFPGIGEGVVGMLEGGRRELIVPPSMNREGTDEVMTYILDLYKVKQDPKPAENPAVAGAEAADRRSFLVRLLWGQ